METVRHPSINDTAVISTAFTNLIRAGSPPPRWVMTSGLLLIVSIAACAGMIWVGVARWGNAGTYFREGMIGTYLSVAMLAGAGAVSILISRKSGTSQRFWFALGVLMIVLAADDLWKLHESI